MRNFWARIKFTYRALKARYRDQKAELEAIRQHVQPGDLVCDIGANKGSYLYWLSLWCRDGRVIAFEPQPVLVRSLRALTQDRSKFRNVVIEAQAAYSSTGEHELYVPWDGAPGASLVHIENEDGSKVVRVPTIALDDFFRDDKRSISLLKIDVEGAELDVFKGAQRILTEQSPMIVFECENRHLSTGTVADVLHYLAGFGYSGSFVKDGALLPLSQFDAALHQKAGPGAFWNSPDYCNNFVLTKSSPPAVQSA